MLGHVFGAQPPMAASTAAAMPAPGMVKVPSLLFDMEVGVLPRGHVANGSRDAVADAAEKRVGARVD